MKIFFDFDGTLIDSRIRLYTLFKQLVPDSMLTFDDYWQLKRNNVPHSKILNEYFNFFEKEISSFEINWISQIEEDRLLKLDNPFNGVTEYLLSLKKSGNKLYLITDRQFEEKVIRQLISYGWIGIFSNILVTQKKKSKEELIQVVLKGDNTGWIVGDTWKDIQIGKILGLKTVAVLSGFNNAQVLSKYKPDIIIENVTLFNPLIFLTKI